MDPRDSRALIELVDVLDSVEVPYAVGGSIAASYFGEPRSTMDVDLLVDLPESKIEMLVGRLTGGFYVDGQVARDAVRRSRAFQALHLATYTKFDLFVAGESELDEEQLRHRVLQPLHEGSERTVYVSSPEMIVLRELDGYRRGDFVADQQWRDVLGVLERRGTSLDFELMGALASRVGLIDSYQRALEESGVSPAS